MKAKVIQQLLDSPNGRRRFLKAASAAGMGAAGLLTAPGARARTLPDGSGGTPFSDTDILNFALNLEYLEAEFYTVATTGQTISQIGIGTSGTGTAGDTTGGNIIVFPDKESQDIANGIAADEQAHVKLLRTALGSAAVAKPAISLNALGVGFGSFSDFLSLARAFEDTGVSAYAGAAPLITSSFVLGVAARVLATEAEHTGNIREQVIRLEIDGGPIGALDSFDVVPTDGRYFSVNFQGLVFVRSPRQVLDIVYHAVGASSGGFFPNGVNGNNTAALAAVPPPQEWPLT